VVVNLYKVTLGINHI